MDTLMKKKSHQRKDSIDNLIDMRLLSLGGAASGAARSTSDGRATRTGKRTSLAASYLKMRESIKPPSAFGVTSPQFIAEETIIVDIGGRYSKIGFVGEPAPRNICATKLTLGDMRMSRAYPKQRFKEGAKLLPVVLSISKVPQSPETWEELGQILMEDLLFRELMIKPDKRRIIILADPWWTEPFEQALVKACFAFKCPGVQLVNSLHTAIFCTGQDTALVMDVGYHTTKVQGTLAGHIVPGSQHWTSVGFYSVMSNFKQLMKELTKLDFERFPVDNEQIEAAITRTCFVSPRETEEELKVNSVSYEFRVKKQSAFCKITGPIRQRSCNVLFDSDRNNIMHLLCDALLAVPVDCRPRLAHNVLLTGGTCCIKGFEARFLEEWDAALDTEKYAVLRPLRRVFRLVRSHFAPNIRMFTGASIYGGLTQRFNEDLFVTADTEEEKRPAVLTQEALLRKHGGSPRSLSSFKRDLNVPRATVGFSTGIGSRSPTSMRRGSKRASLVGYSSNLRSRLDELKKRTSISGGATPGRASALSRGLTSPAPGASKSASDLKGAGRARFDVSKYLTESGAEREAPTEKPKEVHVPAQIDRTESDLGPSRPAAEPVRRGPSHDQYPDATMAPTDEPAVREPDQ